MSSAIVGRKRSREQELSEFMPLSKRINNLHLDPEFGPQIQQAITESQAYNPGLTPEQSSYYFQNKLLYELYLERLRRNGQQLHYRTN